MRVFDKEQENTQLRKELGEVKTELGEVKSMLATMMKMMQQQGSSTPAAATLTSL